MIVGPFQKEVGKRKNSGLSKNFGTSNLNQ